MDTTRQPDWVFRLTSGVAARLVPLSLLLFVAAVVGYGALIPAQAPLPSLLTVAAIFLGVLVLHEALHGLGFLLNGGRPRFGIKIEGGVPYAFASCPGQPFSKGQYTVIGALPLAVIDLAALALVLVPQAAVGGMLAFGFNTAGAVGDLWMLTLVLQSPPGTRFLDPDGTSMAAFLPEGQEAARPRGLDPRGYEWVVVWLVATLFAFGAVLFSALQLATRLNGGSGGILKLGPVTIAEASRSGGHFHGGVQIVPILLLSALIGIGAAAAWSAIAARRRRPV